MGAFCLSEYQAQTQVQYQKNRADFREPKPRYRKREPPIRGFSLYIVR